MDIDTNQYHYRYEDAYESVKGVVEAIDIAAAAIAVLQECGTEPKRPRWKRYGIREDRIASVPPGTELVIFQGFEAAAYCLELSKVGSGKRKPLRIFA